MRRSMLSIVTSVFLSVFLSALFFHQAFAADDQDSAPFIAKSQIEIQSDQYSGAFSTAYTLSIPPGRNNLEPNISLHYSSANEDVNSILGYGWSLSLPTIERLAKQGADSLYERHDFTSSLSGELLSTSLSDGFHGTYGAKNDDGSFLSYTYGADETWTVKDKFGTTYTFGGDTNARLSNPTNPTQVFSWYVTSIRDGNDNSITFFYTKSNNAIYPSAVYYTGHGTELGAFHIDFVRDTRPDVVTSYKTGFPVTVSERISAITVTANNELVRSYVLNYTSGNNTTRSLLSKITETATDEDGGTQTKPPTHFSYSQATNSWDEFPSFSLPFAIGNTGNGSLGVYVFDVNGDALPDIVKSSAYERLVLINNGDNTWTEDPEYVVPVAFTTSSGKDAGIRIMDVNGDGFQDIVKSRSLSAGQEQNVFINNANGTGWTLNPNITIPTTFTNDHGDDIGVRIFDVNGDGLSDIVKARYLTNFLDQAVYINNGNGTGWTQDPNYSLPVPFAAVVSSGVEPSDVNGDGLADLVQGYYNAGVLYQGVYINNGNGTGWTQDTNYTVPIGFIGTLGQDTGARLIDVNGDNLPDIVLGNTFDTGERAQELFINQGNGTGWEFVPDFTLPQSFTGGRGLDLGVREDDFDGDMLTDILYSRKNTDNTTWTDRLFLSRGSRSNLLTEITNSTGSSTNVTYTTSVGDNADLWVPVQVVSSVTENDGLGHLGTTNYEYRDGAYYFENGYHRQFSGFGKVTKTDPLGNKAVSYFHQGNATNTALGEHADEESKIGKEYRSELYDANDHLYQTVIRNWESVSLGNDRNFVYNASTVTQQFDGNSDHTDIAASSLYDETTGNLLQEDAYGFVNSDTDGSFSDLGDDHITTHYTYAHWANGNTSGYASRVMEQTGTGKIVSDTMRRYDGLTGNTVSIGNVTREWHWIKDSKLARTDYAYDEFGMVTATADPNGNTTIYTPDAFHLYPATERNPLGQVTTRTYDYSSGSIIRTTDANGLVTETDYDAFDRPIRELASDITSPTTLVTLKTYAYRDSVMPLAVEEHFFASDDTITDVYSYFDGLGRVIQKRTEGEAGNYNVSDTLYNARGEVESVSLPYTSSGATYTSPTTNTALYESMEYDTLGRVTATHNAAGTITRVFDQSWTTETDPDGNNKSYFTDAFGNLGVVTEEMNGASLTTTYSWDARGNLTSVTDAEGNVRHFTYDGLNNRLSAEDLHAPTDSTFGIWTYTYDPAQNLLTSTNPNGVKFRYTYDALNRMLTEDDPTLSGIDMRYGYDTCQNGIGRLCSGTNMNGAITSYAYDILGNTKEETRLVNGEEFVTSFTYDRQGTLTSLIYPDGSAATYDFNNAGQLSSVAFQDANGSGSVVVADAVTYGPHGKVTSVTYGNGVTTQYTYDANELYRLRDVQTHNSSTSLENFHYTYDAVGNLLQVSDHSDLYANIDVNYEYDDLHRLTNASSTSSDTALAYVKNWTYSPIGNILSSSENGTYAYNGTNSGNYANPHAATSIGTKTLTYNANGDLLSDGTWSNTWNQRNQLIRSQNGNVVVTYSYDHEGNRVTETDSSHERTYANAYYALENDEVKRHIFAGPLGEVATSIFDGSTSSLFYHHKDHLGGTHVETGANGDAVEYILYTPFGDTLLDAKTGNYENDLKYTGKEKDDSTGWYYYGARYYNPSTGQFMSEDPVFLAFSRGEKEINQALSYSQALNSYAYARNSPTFRVDVDGRWPSLPWTMRAIDDTTRVVDKAFNFITLGAGKKAAEMGKTGITAGGVVRVTTGVAFGVTTASVVAFSAGVAIAVGSGAAAAAGTTTVTVGTRLGPLGTVVANQSGKITGVTNHASEQMIARSVTMEMMQKVVSSPLVTLQQSGGKALYLTQEAAVVLNKTGQVVTTYSSTQFNQTIQSIINSVK